VNRARRPAPLPTAFCAHRSDAGLRVRDLLTGGGERPASHQVLLGAPCLGDAGRLQFCRRQPSQARYRKLAGSRGSPAGRRRVANRTQHQTISVTLQDRRDRGAIRMLDVAGRSAGAAISCKMAWPSTRLIPRNSVARCARPASMPNGRKNMGRIHGPCSSGRSACWAEP
jgi:hypothetical protein